MKLKIKVISSIVLLLISFNTFVFANEDEDLLSLNEIEDILLEETSNTIIEEPDINSRNAVIYDRKTRYSVIWKKGK